MTPWILSLILSAPLALFAAEKSAELTVYTSRKTHLIEPLFAAYSKKTGVKINHINNQAGVLIQKMKQEGAKTKADLFITVDAGNLGYAASEGLLAPITSKELLSKIPQDYHGEQDMWLALSLRARTIFFNKNKVKATDLKSYADLADPKWKAKLCLRTSRKVYNQSLVAAMIQQKGEAETKKVVRGWVNNLAKPVFTNDTLLLEAIDKGTCQVGIANTYYLARLIKEGKAKNVQVFWPSEKEGGVHVNVSGAGIVKASKNKAEATRFLKWLLTDEAQQIFAGVNDEYPAVRNVKVSKILQDWGEFKREEAKLKSIAPLQKKAVLLMDSVKYR
jgi:iron(III) transport system substrate-binding protein